MAPQQRGGAIGRWMQSSSRAAMMPRSRPPGLGRGIIAVACTPRAPPSRVQYRGACRRCRKRGLWLLAGSTPPPPCARMPPLARNGDAGTIRRAQLIGERVKRSYQIATLVRCEPSSVGVAMLRDVRDAIRAHHTSCCVRGLRIRLCRTNCATLARAAKSALEASVDTR